MMRVAIVGFGRVGEAHAACYDNLPGVRVTAVADICAARRHLAAQRYPRAHIVAGLAGMTAACDLAVIGTPPTSHEPLIEMALRRGLHVFCEKPAFLDPGNARRLIALAADHHLIIYPGHNYLFAPMLHHLRTAAARGDIGAIRHVSITVRRTGPASGTADWQPRWRTDPRHSGGGILADHGPHCVYLAEWLSGQRVSTADIVTDGAPVDHDATVSMTLTGGVTATAKMSWRAATRTSRYHLTGATDDAWLHDNRLRLPGSVTADGAHETPATSHAHHDWMPALATDVISSLNNPSRLRPLTEPAVTIADVLQRARANPATRP